MTNMLRNKIKLLNGLHTMHIGHWSHMVVSETCSGLQYCKFKKMCSLLNATAVNYTMSNNCTLFNLL